MDESKRKEWERRREFVRERLAGRESMAELCRRYGFSRARGYRWWRRFCAGGEAALADRGSRPHQAGPGRQRERWRAEVLAQRAKTGAGARTLRAWLRLKHPRAHLPSERTLGRLLAQEGQTKAPRRRQRGPVVPVAPREEPRRCHDVWTIDFKGVFRTGDGQRCEALTVRDGFSRCLLWIEQVSAESDAAVRAVLERCFQAHGLPRAIWVDNGVPFGNRGPRGLTKLSVWWVRLGIRVQFSRRGKPQDNGAHEQMHRILKQQTASPPAGTLAEQAERFGAFQSWYNEERPHQGLGGQPPARFYRQNRRRYREVERLRYPAEWEQLKVSAHGQVYWRKHLRQIGRAFAGQIVGLQRKAPGAQARPGEEEVEVYLGQLLLGELSAHRAEDLRAVWSGENRGAKRRAPSARPQ